MPAGKEMYFVPYHLYEKLPFEPRFEFFHAALSFPPKIKWEFNHFQKFRQAVALYIPEDKNVTGIDNVSKKEESVDRPEVTRGHLLPFQYGYWRYSLFTFDQITKDMSIEQKLRNTGY